MKYYVVGTVRNKNGSIGGLVLDRDFNGLRARTLEDLEVLADVNLLWVKKGQGISCKEVAIEIYYDHAHDRLDARTVGDGVLCDNLRSLPIYRVGDNYLTRSY